MNTKTSSTSIRLTCVLLAAAALAGCAGSGQLTQQQKDGVELRRYCESNPEDVEKCLGFLGWR